MKQYRCRVIDQDHTQKEKILWGESVNEIAWRLKNKAYTIITIKEINSLQKGLKKWKYKDVMEFAYRMSLLVSSGIPLRKIMEMLCEQYNNNLYKSLRESIERGITLSDSLKELQFPTLAITLLKAGEKSGALEESFTLIYKYYEQQLSYKRKIVGALVYPLFLLILMLIFFLLAVIVILPSFKKVFMSMNVELPLITRIIFSIGDFTQMYMLYIVCSIGILFLLLYLYFKNGGKKRWEEWLWNRIHVFPIGACIIYLPILKVWSLLLESGIPLLETLRLSKKLWLIDYGQKKNTELIEVLESGISFGLALDKVQVGTNFMKELIKIGEETGETISMIKHCVGYYEAYLERFISRVERMLEPIMLSFIGLGIGVMVLSVMLPMFNSISAMMK